VGVYKPHPRIFEEALNDLDSGAEETVFIGESFAIDIEGASRVGMTAVLYDPLWRELRALHAEDFSGKVVSIDVLKQNRKVKDIKIVTRLEELLEFFR
jgi:putative hydrolase of the HAD superfamily